MPKYHHLDQVRNELLRRQITTDLAGLTAGLPENIIEGITTLLNTPNDIYTALFTYFNHLQLTHLLSYLEAAKNNVQVNIATIIIDLQKKGLEWLQSLTNAEAPPTDEQNFLPITVEDIKPDLTALFKAAVDTDLAKTNFFEDLALFQMCCGGQIPYWPQDDGLNKYVSQDLLTETEWGLYQAENQRWKAPQENSSSSSPTYYQHFALTVAHLYVAFELHNIKDPSMPQRKELISKLSYIKSTDSAQHWQQVKTILQQQHFTDRNLTGALARYGYYVLEAAVVILLLARVAYNIKLATQRYGVKGWHCFSLYTTRSARMVKQAEYDMSFLELPSARGRAASGG